MSNEQTPSKQARGGERIPVRIEKLIIAGSNPHGVMLPWGMNGETERQQHRLVAGINGAEKVEIEHRPWMRVFRITKYRQVGDRWEPMGKPYHMPDSWAVSVPVDE